MRLSEVVGKNYDHFWNSKHRYRVVKGSKGSKKSITAAINLIINIMKHPESNALVCKKVAATLRKSVFNNLIWAINTLNVGKYWKINNSSFELTYMPTGQKIYLTGLDDPTKLGGIMPPTGYLCWVWIDEFYEIQSEEEFEKLDFLLRGKLPPHLWYQFTLTFNPWTRLHWSRERFYKDSQEREYINDDEDIFAITTNYTHNEFLDNASIKNYERLKQNNPKLFEVIGMGNWGITEGMIFTNWEQIDFSDFFYSSIEEIKYDSRNQLCIGLDYGYTHDPTALIVSYVDFENKLIYIVDEHYQTGMSNKQIADMIIYKNLKPHKIIAEIEPKSNDELRKNGLYVEQTSKGKDSINFGIQFLQQFKIYISKNCTNTILEFSNYRWDKDKNGKSTNKPKAGYDHLMDALRYSMKDIQTSREIKAITIW